MTNLSGWLNIHVFIDAKLRFENHGALLLSGSVKPNLGFGCDKKEEVMNKLKLGRKRGGF